MKLYKYIGLGLALLGGLALVDNFIYPKILPGLMQDHYSYPVAADSPVRFETPGQVHALALANLNILLAASGSLLAGLIMLLIYYRKKKRPDKKKT